jgi:hypothetical protein
MFEVNNKYKESIEELIKDDRTPNEAYDIVKNGIKFNNIIKKSRTRIDINDNSQNDIIINEMHTDINNKNTEIQKLKKIIQDFKNNNLDLEYNYKRELQNKKLEFNDELQNILDAERNKNNEKNNELEKQIRELKDKLSNFEIEKYKEREKIQIEFENKKENDNISIKELYTNLIAEKDNTIKDKEILLEEKEKEKIEIEKIKNYEIEKLEKENQEYKSKYDKVEQNSSLKGIAFEERLDEELQEYFDKKTNIYLLEKCSGTGGKGDFIVTNNNTKIRIMLEAKNMDKVKKYDKNQLDKFYNDLNDLTNNYDAGIMICTGKISGKKDYDFEKNETNDKISSFISDYRLNNTKEIYLLIDMIHNYIFLMRNNNEDISKNAIIDIMINEYKELLKLRDIQKKTLENIDELIKKKKENFYNLFKDAIDEYGLKKKNIEKNTNEHLSTKINKCIEELFKDGYNNEECKQKLHSDFEEYIKMYNDGDKKNGIRQATITTKINNYYKNNKQETKKRSVPVKSNSIKSHFDSANNGIISKNTLTIKTK